jgi:hypothetical protein
MVEFVLDFYGNTLLQTSFFELLSQLILMDETNNGQTVNQNILDWDIDASLRQTTHIALH